LHRVVGRIRMVVSTRAERDVRDGDLISYRRNVLTCILSIYPGGGLYLDAVVLTTCLVEFGWSAIGIQLRR
jgi:hypothetical protein